MPEIGDIVLFLDGTAGKAVEAEVVSVNEDGTINILYPHPFVAGVRADASQVEAGLGTWQWQANSAANRKALADGVVVETVADEPVEDLPSEERGTGATIHRKVTSRRSRGVSVDAP